MLQNTSVGTIVFNDIHTTDPDTATGGVVFYQMVVSTSFQKSRASFFGEIGETYSIAT